MSHDAAYAFWQRGVIARLGHWPFVRWLARRFYRLTTRHRAAAGRVDRLLFGTATAAPTRRLVTWVFLRALGGVYLIAFTSLRAQALGLYGSRGVEPIGGLLTDLRGRAGRAAYRIAPSLLRLGSSDRDRGGRKQGQPENRRAQAAGHGCRPRFAR
jgi:hypothetical protein